jgi:site-specific DNA recombinase
MEHQYKSINDVAIYLRKSRGVDEDLDKHKLILTELSKKYNWKYTIYQEVGTSDSIVDRKEFQKLLKDIENDLYDAILVVDLDRLSRGNQEDQGYINRIFSDTDTKVITPSKVYDYNDEDQTMELELVNFMARFEYNMIKKRLFRGKKVGAMQGKFTNGKPPYPYYYDREERKVKIDEEKLKVYNWIKDKFFEGIPPYQIAYELNKTGIPSPGNTTWSNNAVHRLLTNEFHMGKIIYCKTQGSGHKNKKTKPLKKRPREQWIISQGEHEPVKTEEEHYQILAMLAKRKICAHAARKGKRILSGILKCKLCGRGASFYDRKSGEYIKPCTNYTPTGEKCPNRGFKAKYIYDALNKELDKYKDELLKYDPQKSEKSKQIQNLINVKEAQLKRLQESISRIQELFEMGHINKKEYLERWEKRNEEIQSVIREIEDLKLSNEYYKQPSPEELIGRINRFQDIWDGKDFTNEEKNRLIKQIVREITYLREGDDLYIDIKFL